MKNYIKMVLLVASLAISSTSRSQQYVYTPTNIAGAWATTVVPDMLLWYSASGYYTNGPITNLAAQVADLANWEPYIDVMGDSVFLIGANTFANDPSLTNQQYVVTFQPVAGGAPVNGSEIFADSATPFTAEVDLSRENGNPERVAGDRRIGATNFVTMAETSAGQLPGFQSDSRWKANSAMYTGVNRYCTEQVFSLNPSTLVQSPLKEAWDFVYGPMTATTLPTGNGGTQLSRTGGRPVVLDNGNIALVIDDKTCFLSTSSEVTTFAIITPAGEIVTGPTLVNPNAIWDNVAAYSGGFAVRVGSYLAFYDDLGNLVSSTNVNDASGLQFDSGRGDNTRIAADIRSHYVYLAGETPDNAPNNPVSLAIFDPRTAQCVATNMVSDTDPALHEIDRVNVAVDAMDHFCVVYDMNPNPAIWANDQIVARVGRFDGTNITFATPSFYPFINSENNSGNVLGFLTETPSAAMTTSYICIAGKGTINGTNSAIAGPNTAAQTKLYTVINNPYAAVSVTLPTLSISQVSGSSVQVSWPGGGTLQSATALSTNTVWTSLPNSSPARFTVAPGAMFFRLLNP